MFSFDWQEVQLQDQRKSQQELTKSIALSTAQPMR